MAKFTPYGFTGIPSNPQDRDVNGVYFIRTSTGFKLYTIANTPSRDILELETTETNTHVPYTGAVNDVDLNTKKLSINGTFNKGIDTFDVKDLGGGTSPSNHLKKYYDVSGVVCPDGAQNGILKVEIPIQAVTMWSVEISLQEYLSPNSYRIERRTNLIISGSHTTNYGLSVNCDNPWRIDRVKFGRNAANTKTVILIYTNSGTVIHGKAIINSVQTARAYSNSLDVKNNYNISFVPTLDIPGLDFIFSDEVLRSGFQRRDEHLEFGLGSKTVNDGWATDDLDALKVGNFAPTGFIGTFTNNPTGNAPGFTYPFGIHFNGSSSIRGDVILSHAHNRLAFRSNGRDFTEVWTDYNLQGGTVSQLVTGTSTDLSIWSPKTLSDWVNSLITAPYVLPTASTTVKGGIKVGSYLSVASEVLSVKVGTTSDTVAVGNDSRINNGQTAFSWGNHASAGYSTQTLIAGTNVTITGSTISATDTKYTAGNGLTLIGTSFSVNFGTAANTVAQGNDSRINNGQTAFSWGNHAGLYKPINWLPNWTDLQGPSPIGDGLLRILDGDDNIDLFTANQFGTSTIKKRQLLPQSNFWTTSTLNLSSSKKDQLVGFYDTSGDVTLLLPTDPENKQQIEVCNKSDTYFVNIKAGIKSIDFGSSDYLLGRKMTVRLMYILDLDTWIVVEISPN